MVEDIVYIPVPRRWLEPVYKRLGELEAHNEPNVPDIAPDADLLEKMYRDSHEQHRRLMRFLAAHPDQWFYSGELAQALELRHGARGLAGMLGAFGRRAKHRYGGSKPWDSDWDSNREEARHRIRPEVASIVDAVAQRLE